MQTAFISLTKTKSLWKKTQQSWRGWGWGASANTVLTGFLGDAQGENGNSTLLDGLKPAGQETWAPRAKDLLFSFCQVEFLVYLLHFILQPENGNDLPNISENDVISRAGFHASPTSFSTAHDS